MTGSVVQVSESTNAQSNWVEESKDGEESNSISKQMLTEALAEKHSQHGGGIGTDSSIA